MRINKDLAEAVMMVSFIVLVLVGTTDFESATTKSVVMGLLGFLVVGFGIARYWRKSSPQEE